MAPSIGLKWPIDEDTIVSGVAVYVSGDKAKKLLVAGNGHEFRLEAGRIVIADPAGEYGPEAAQFARRLGERSPRPNRHRAICRIESSEREEYDACITTYPGNRANLDGVIDLIAQTLYAPDETPGIVYVR